MKQQKRECYQVTVSLGPDFHILCEMSFYVFCVELHVLNSLFFTEISGCHLSRFQSTRCMAIHRNNIMWNLFCAAQVIKCYIAITGKQTPITIVPKF